MTETESRIRTITWIGLLALVMLPIARTAAQGNAQCNAYGQGLTGSVQARNLCNAAVDGASVFTPVAGILVNGGNPFLGSSGGRLGLGHIGITLRANLTSLAVPDLQYNGDGTTVGEQQRILTPAPLVEAGAGLFRGIGHGTLAIDVLGSAQLLPTGLFQHVHIAVDARHIGSIALGLGIGGRLTLLGESRGTPGIAVSVMHRSLPRIGVGSVVAGDRYAYSADLGSTSLRATMSKRVGVAELGVGGGWTHFASDADIVFVNPLTGQTEPTISPHVSDSRLVGYVDAGLSAGPVYLIGELGVQQGKDLHLVTTFSGNDPASSRIFGSIGLRLGR